MAKKNNPATSSTPATSSVPATFSVDLIMLAFKAVCEILQGKVHEPETKIGGKKYLSGGAIFRTLKIVKPEEKLKIQPVLDAMFQGKVEIPNLPKEKVEKILDAFQKRYATEVCYRPNFEWSGKREGEKNMVFGLGDDWPKLAERWEASAKQNGGVPDADAVAALYGSDKYGPLMTGKYVAHVVSEGVKHGMAITPPVKKGRGRRADVPRTADADKMANEVIAKLNL